MMNSHRCTKVAAPTLLVAALTVMGMAWNPAVSATQPPPPVATNAPGAVQQTVASVDVASATASSTHVQKQNNKQTLERIATAMIEAEKRRLELNRPDPAVPPSFIEQWGVQVIGVNYTADGFWLDFRFRVIDPDKARMLFDNRFKPYLESEQSGVKLAIPSPSKIGAMRTTNRAGNIKAGKIYTMIFANPNFHVKPGQKVTVVAGDFKVEHLTVRGQAHTKLGRAP